MTSFSHDEGAECPLGKLADHMLMVTRASSAVYGVVLLVDAGDPEHVAVAIDGIDPVYAAQLLERYAAKLRRRLAEGVHASFVRGSG